MTVRIPRSARTARGIWNVASDGDFIKTIFNQRYQTAGPNSMEGLQDYKRRMFKRGGK